MKFRDTVGTRGLRFFLALSVFVALATFALTQVRVPKVAADIKGVETLECDPDTDAIVSAQGPVAGVGACTSFMVTLDTLGFKIKDSKGPEEIGREHIVAGTDTGPGHSYYLMIFVKD